MLSSLNFEVKTQQYFVSSSDMFLEKKSLLEIWLKTHWFSKGNVYEKLCTSEKERIRKLSW